MPAVDLAAMIHAAATDVLTRRGFGVDALPTEVDVERPRNRDHGDYATTFALRSATRLGLAPRELASWLADALSCDDRIASAEVAGPGFINLLLAPDSRPTLIADVLAAGEHYGRGAELSDQTVILEPIAADDVPLAHARGATSTDALARILAARGARVVRRHRDRRALADQPVHVLAAGAPAAMATLDDLIASVGVDAARYALIRLAPNGRSDLELNLLTRYNIDNPVFAVQHAHARTASLVDNAARIGLTPGDRYDLLGHPRDGELIRSIGEFPAVMSSAARRREPHRVARYLETLAVTFHCFHDSCRVLPMGDELITELNQARLALCEATRQVLANGLRLLGVRAPERM
jgi:arginyl-tRNA synthetase